MVGRRRGNYSFGNHNIASWWVCPSAEYSTWESPLGNNFKLTRHLSCTHILLQPSYLRHVNRLKQGSEGPHAEDRARNSRENARILWNDVRVKWWNVVLSGTMGLIRASNESVQPQCLQAAWRRTNSEVPDNMNAPRTIVVKPVYSWCGEKTSQLLS